uniref:Putative ovule protein n=1 Tax=Solanum chacoense TaxID=4108 RepID=A0A0V0HKT7_SOLCH
MSFGFHLVIFTCLLLYTSTPSTKILDPPLTIGSHYLYNTICTWVRACAGKFPSRVGMGHSSTLCCKTFCWSELTILPTSLARQEN